jgi:hypothetical protein
VNPASTGLPAYLSRLAVGPPAAQPPLQPPRPLFEATAVPSEAELDTPPAGFASGAAAPSASLPEEGERAPSPAGAPAGGEQITAFAAPEQIARIPAAAPTRAAATAMPVDRGALSGRRAGGTTPTAPPAQPALATPSTTAAGTATPNWRPDDSAGNRVLLAERRGARISEARGGNSLAPATSPEPAPMPDSTARPAGSAQPGFAGTEPRSAASRQLSASQTTAAMQPRLAVAPDAEPLLPRPTPDEAASSDHGSRWRAAPATAPTSAARVDIGTIEVTVLPPPPPAPVVQPPPSGADAGGQPGADVAMRAARGAARRWFGAGQS